MNVTKHATRSSWATSTWEKFYAMNTQQKFLVLGASMVGLAVMFPPFEFRGMNGMVLNLGYGFLFAPPKHPYNERLSGSVNVGLLAIEIATVCLVVSAAYVITNAQRKKEPR